MVKPPDRSRPTPTLSNNYLFYILIYDVLFPPRLTWTPTPPRSSPACAPSAISRLRRGLEWISCIGQFTCKTVAYLLNALKEALAADVYTPAERAAV
jgi:hypothetical protein